MGKTFRSSVSKKRVEFTLSGGDGDEYPEFAEDFVARGTIPIGLILEFGEMSEIVGVGEVDAAVIAQSGGKMLDVIKQLFDSVLPAKDRPRFQQLLKDPERPVEFEVLMETMNYLISELSARPTGEPSSTSSQASQTGLDSTPGAYPVGTTFSRAPLESVVSSA